MTPRTPAQVIRHQQLSTILFYAAVLLLGYAIFLIFRPFLESLAWAVILVILFHRWHLKLEERLGKNGGAAASTTIVTLLLIIPALLLAVFFTHETIHVGGKLSRSFTEGRIPWLNNAWNWIANEFGGDQGFDLPTVAHNVGATIGERAAQVLAFVFTHMVKFFFDLFVMVFALFFFFRDADVLTNCSLLLLPFDEGQRNTLVTRTEELIFATVTTSLAIAAAQGAIGGVSFWIAGISPAFFWGVMIAFFSLVPMIGSTIIWVPAAIWLIATGHTGKAILLFALCGGLMSIVEHVVKPVMLAGRVHLSGLFVFIAVVGGLAVFGILGIVLGPVLVATAAGVLEIYVAE